MNPNQSVPDTVASGLAAPLPGVPINAFASTNAMMIRATIQNSAPDFGIGNDARWLAAPMKNSIGTENTTLVREASPARAPAGPTAGLAGRPAAVSMAFWMMIF